MDLRNIPFLDDFLRKQRQKARDKEMLENKKKLRETLGLDPMDFDRLNGYISKSNVARNSLLDHSLLDPCIFGEDRERRWSNYSYIRELEEILDRKQKGETLSNTDYRRLLSDKFRQASTLRTLANEMIPPSDGRAYIDSEREFGEVLSDIMRQGNISQKSFIDVGCGVPIFSDFMKDLGCKEVHGLEYNSNLVKMVQPYYPDVNIHTGDMREYQEYGKYDILYMYHPLKSGMNEALLSIIDQMKPGAVLYFVDANRYFSNFLKIHNFKKLNNDVVDSNIYKFIK
ncbi:MAG: class I SAM-dependent methyltransferase [Candidatus Peribacteria bacterium]|jgi:2-polyprenyl-3-methyl-5-hydroxy-6-metoxy-1,4-benzoquinol methylase|nr:class I SAM-dependent methyltransferase [Candidatus Peribacteria bacterium]